jgi:Ca2+-transporting ATPase
MTMYFVVIVASQLFYSLSMRNATKSIFQIGFFTNMKLIGAIIVGFILQFGVITIPAFARAFKVHTLSLYDWCLVIAFALVPFLVNELLKVFMKSVYKE